MPRRRVGRCDERERPDPSGAARGAPGVGAGAASARRRPREIAASIARESRPELGAAGLAKQQGFRSPATMIAATTGGSTGDAVRLVKVGEATAPRANLIGEPLPPRNPEVQRAIGCRRARCGIRGADRGPARSGATQGRRRPPRRGRATARRALPRGSRSMTCAKLVVRCRSLARPRRCGSARRRGPVAALADHVRARRVACTSPCRPTSPPGLP